MIFTDYALRFNYYATELCENKDDETRQCNGLCQVTKEIQDNQPDNTPKAPSNEEISTFVLFELFFLNFGNVFQNESKASHYLSSILEGTNPSLIKPPII
jgi:hypothetical protein